MGYYVELIKSSFVLPAENEREAYRRMCDLNKRDDLKRGGRGGSGEKTQTWFAWMKPNYPETCENAAAILSMLGFETEVEENGDTRLTYYDSKAGDEEVFLKTIADLCKGELVWRGEEGEHWVLAFAPGKEMKTKTARLTWDD